MIGWKKTSVDNVWELPDGRFTYATEAEYSDVVYSNFEDAVKALNRYKCYTVEGLGHRLNQEVLLVTFTKTDGTLRTMRCTAAPTAFPVRESTGRTKAPNPDVQVVWDLDKQSVRSFRKDSVVGFTA